MSAPAHDSDSFNLTDYILHHVQDSVMVEIPWHPFGLDLHITKHIVFMWIASAAIILLSWLFSRKISAKEPSRGIAGMFESVIDYVYTQVVLPQVGHDGKRYAPYLVTLFFFILFCNLLGLVPGGATATGNIAVTGALAFLTFMIVHIWGMQAQGAVAYWKNIVPHSLAHGPMLLVGIAVFLVEMIAHVARSFALAMRLFANMVAGHLIIFSFIGLIFLFKNAYIGAGAVPMAVAITFLEILVAFIQAYVFTLLTSIFVGMGLHPEH